MGIMDALNAQRMAQEGAAFPIKTALDFKRAQLDMEEAAQTHAAEMRKFQQDRQMQNMQMQQQRQEMGRNAAIEQAKKTGMAAYVNQLRNPETTQVEGDRLFPAQVGPMPPKQVNVPMTFENVSRSILKKNPNIDPAAFSAAMEKFAPQFEMQDKMKLAQLRSMAGGSTVGQIQQLADKLGIPFEDAQKRFTDLKRRSVDEEGAVAGAKETAKLTAGREGELAKKEVSSQAMLSMIQDARKELPKATGSGAGAVLAKGKKFVGVSDEQTRANAKLKAIGGWMKSNVPRMEGPQSDKDTVLYGEMAAQVGDESIPISDREAALDTLEALQKKYSSGGELSSNPKSTTPSAADDPLGLFQ